MPPKRPYSGTYGRRTRRRTGRYDPQRIVASRRRGYARVLGRASGALVMTPEKKYFDSELSLTSTPNTTAWGAGNVLNPSATPVASIDTLFCPKDGSGINQRIGRKVAVHKIKLRGTVQCAPQADQTGSDAANMIRMMLVQNKQTNGAEMNASELMRDAGLTSATSLFQSFQSTNNFGKFRVLKDKIITIQNPNMAYDGTNIEQQGLMKPWKMSVTFRKPVIVHFNSTNGGTVADIVDNSFNFVIQGLNANLATTFSYACRVVYSDA